MPIKNSDLSEGLSAQDPHPLEHTLHYAGFWPRLLGNAADFLLISAIVTPILVAIYGPGYLFDGNLIEGQWHIVIGGVFPAVAALAFLFKRQATPGKMMINAHIVCAESGHKPLNRQFIIRYLAFLILTPLSLGLSCIWIFFDPRKQGWHDKVAGTVVVKRPQERGN